MGLISRIAAVALGAAALTAQAQNISIGTGGSTGLLEPLAVGAPWLVLMLGSFVALLGFAWWRLRKP